MSLLRLDHLSVVFGQGEGAVTAVHDASFVLEKGETLALVGESGSGKSVTALSLLGLLPTPNARHPSGTVTFNEQAFRPEETAPLRGRKIAMIFQEPMTSLNPLHTIARQIGEVLVLHKQMDAGAARARTLELLRLVALPEPEKRLDSYPHELSGGQRQRVMIAMALASEPELLIADEPTTALDVTIQAQILALLKELQKKFGMALLLITHDLSIVRRMADRVAVMRQGLLVEQGPAAALFAAPKHPYTQALLASEPKGPPLPVSADSPVVLEASGIKVHFPVKKGLLRRTVSVIRAVEDVSFTLRAGETIGIVGESGSGKTTLGLALLRLLPAQGQIVFQGQPLHAMGRGQLRPLRQALQIVFQDPYGSLNPRLTVGSIVAEGLDIHAPTLSAATRQERVEEALREVNLDPAMAERYPHEFSGGQRQRIAIARAMILKPRCVVLDEPTSALDVSVQAQIVALLRDLQQRHQLAYLFISHDLRVVRALANRVIVMKEGRVVEQGDAAQLFAAPTQPYTRALLDAALNLKPAAAS